MLNKYSVQHDHPSLQWSRAWDYTLTKLSDCLIYVKHVSSTLYAPSYIHLFESNHTGAHNIIQKYAQKEILHRTEIEQRIGLDAINKDRISVGRKSYSILAASVDNEWMLNNGSKSNIACQSPAETAEGYSLFKKTTGKKNVGLVPTLCTHPPRAVQSANLTLELCKVQT